MLGHEEVQHLLNTLQKSAPKLVEDLIPRVMPLASVVRVLQGLLAERVPIKNIRTIVETLAEHAPRTPDPTALQNLVRVALGRQIVQDIAGIGGELPVITLEPDLERLLSNSVTGSGQNGPTPPAWSPDWQSVCSFGWQSQRNVRRCRASRLCCWWRLSCGTCSRGSCGRRCRRLHVLAWNEIPDNRKVRLVTAVGR